MFKIALVGAGINGLALAIALRQLGFLPNEIEIYEKDTIPRALGTGIIFWAEAMKILKRIGIDLTKDGISLTKLKYLFLNEIDAPTVVDIKKPADQASFGLLRENIYRKLQLKAESLGVFIKAGFECQNVIEQENECVLIFKDKAPIIADAVIGCDGIYSKIRSIVFPSVDPISLNIRAYRGTYVGSNENIVRLNLPLDICHINCGPQWRVLIYPNFSYADNTTSYYWFAAHRINPSEYHEHFSNTVTVDEIEELIQRLPESPPYLHALLRETDLPQIIRSSTLKQLPPSECSRGRVALLGDAAHAMAPTAGLGVLLGLINALRLASSLKVYRYNIPAAIKHYGASVIDHSTACLNLTYQLTELFYVDNPLKSAAQAQAVHKELFTLIDSTTSSSLEFYNNTIAQRNFAARYIQRFFHLLHKTSRNSSASELKTEL